MPAALGDPLDEPLCGLVLDEVGDRTDLQPVLGGEPFEIGEPRHRAIGVHDFTEHRGWRKPGERREIAAGLGVAGARQHAARLRNQRKNMAGVHDVRRLRVGRGGNADRVRAIRRRDPG